MVNLIKKLVYIGIKYIFIFLINRCVNRCDGVAAGTTWAEPVTIRFKSSLPLGFEGHKGSRLFSSVSQC